MRSQVFNLSSFFSKNLCLFFLGWSVILFSQKKMDDDKTKEFYSTYHQFQLDHKNSEKYGKEMLRLSQSKYQNSLAYFTLGIGRYENGDYIKAVDFMQNAFDNASAVDSTKMTLDVLMTLVPAYRRAGLVVQSDKNFALMQDLAKKVPEYERSIYLLSTEAKIFDIDKDYCKAAEIRKKAFNILKPVSPDPQIDNRYRFSVLNQLCYVQIKCGEFEQALKTLSQIDGILNSLDQNPIKLKEFYHLNKALLAKNDGKVDEAKINFDLASDLVMDSDNSIIIKEIFTERLNANIDTPEKQLEFSKMVREISDKETTVTKKFTSQETQKSSYKLQEEERKNKWLLGVAIASTALFVLALYLYRQRTLKLKKQYLKIIQELENPNVPMVVNIDDVKEEKNAGTLDTFISREKESEILKNFEFFEKRKRFNTKGISAAQMATELKTSTKYLTYILKKYRNADFYNYINESRINFIVRELHDNPKLLNYKIAALSNMCGYTSHSHFANIFKNSKGISPSQFIEFLKEENRS